MADAALPADPASILLIRLGGLGDLLAVVPSVRLIRRIYPHSRLTLAGREEYGLLLAAAGLIDEVVPAGSTRFASLYGESAPDREPGGPGDWLAGSDLALGWFQGGGTAGRDLQKALTRRGIRARMLARDLNDRRAMGRGYFEETLRSLEMPPDRVEAFESFVGLPLTERILSAGRELAATAGLDPGTSFIVIHPGAGSRTKRWPLDRFLWLAGELDREWGPVLFVTGEADGDIAAEIGRDRSPRRWKHVAEPGLLALTGLLSSCALFIGNDSGVTHLAAAAGAPVLAVFRTEFEDAWRPEGRVTLLHAKDVDLIPAEDLLTEARRALGLSVPSGELHKKLCKKP